MRAAQRRKQRMNEKQDVISDHGRRLVLFLGGGVQASRGLNIFTILAVPGSYVADTTLDGNARTVWS